MLTTILSVGILLAFALIAFCLIKWWGVRNVGVTPVHLFTFIAILFTSGLDVGLIMFPLTEFPVYADTAAAPEYGFANPLAIEFGFWGFLIWGFYFLTAFYFCVIEPRVGFFEIPVVKLINNIVILGTCAFTGYLFLTYLPFYATGIIGDGETLSWHFYAIVFLTIALATYSSTDIKLVLVLSLASTWLFFALIAGMWAAAAMGFDGLLGTMGLVGEYFTNIDKFVLPINDYHQFYLFWWFAWSIMIGQFTSRFVGGLKTWQVLLALLIFPSIPLLVWFSVLHYYWANELATGGLIAISMLVVGVTFVINSLDSLIRLYTDNLNLTSERLGKPVYLVLNILALFGLVIMYKSGWMQIEWIGSIVIGIYFACVFYIAFFKRKEVMAITSSPEDRNLDFHKIETTH